MGRGTTSTSIRHIEGIIYSLPVRYEIFTRRIEFYFSEEVKFQWACSDHDRIMKNTTGIPAKSATMSSAGILLEPTSTGMEYKSNVPGPKIMMYWTASRMITLRTHHLAVVGYPGKNTLEQPSSTAYLQVVSLGRVAHRSKASASTVISGSSSCWANSGTEPRTYQSPT